MNYFDGALMAYDDCAKLADHLANNLPPDLQFLKSQFLILSERIRDKRENVKLLMDEGANG